MWKQSVCCSCSKPLTMNVLLQRRQVQWQHPTMMKQLQKWRKENLKQTLLPRKKLMMQNGGKKKKKLPREWLMRKMKSVLQILNSLISKWLIFERRHKRQGNKLKSWDGHLLLACPLRGLWHDTCCPLPLVYMHAGMHESNVFVHDNCAMFSGLLLLLLKGQMRLAVLSNKGLMHVF